jgi:4-hydroxy-2-oxoglutarate aldolase
MNLHGVLLPLTTPFDGDAVQPSRLAVAIPRYEAHGVAGYLVLGSTGEAALLDEEEKVRVLAAAREAIPRSRTMLAGVGVESTAATVRLARRAADAGADGLLVLSPFFFRSRMTADALVRHFSAVADASPVPILLYNVPVYTSLVIPPAVVETMAGHPNVIGLKDSAGDVPWMLDVLARVPATFQVVCGSAPAFLFALLSGAVGAILAIGNAFPELAVGVYRLHENGRAAEALALQKALAAATRLVAGAHGIAGVKAAMDLRGLPGGDPRPPLLPLGGAERAAIAGEIDRLLARHLLERREI